MPVHSVIDGISWQVKRLTVHQFDSCRSGVKNIEAYYHNGVLLSQFLPAVHLILEFFIFLQDSASTHSAFQVSCP